MPKATTSRYFETDVFPVATDGGDELIAEVAAVTPMSRPGVVRLRLYRSTSAPEDHETHRTFHLSEAAARRLIEQLTRIVNQLESARGLYKMGYLVESALVDPEKLDWPLLDSSDQNGGVP